MASNRAARGSEAANESKVDVRALAAALRARVRGEVRFDDGSRALYTTDGSVYRQVPLGVVIPHDAEDVIATVAVCREHEAPILPRGGGTSTTGQGCNAAVVIDMTKYMNNIITIDPQRKQARVQPGVILDTLRDAAERYHLTFGPDPATHNRCVLGGMIGNNSCGVHAVMAGKTDVNTEELDILTYDGLRMRVGHTSDEELQRIIGEGGRRGEIYAGLRSLRDSCADLIRARFPQIPRRISGFNLEQLLPENGFHVARALVGSEGTCVTVLEATLRLVDSPPARPLLVLGYPDAYSAADHIMEVLAHGPIGLEGFDDRLIAAMEKKGMHTRDITLLPEGGGWLLAEFGAQTEQEAADRARALMDELRGKNHAPSMKLFTDAQEKERVWAVRESGVGAVSNVPGEPLVWPGWEDAAVHPEDLGRYLRDFRALLDRYGYRGAYFGHFGQACIHVRIDFDLRSDEGIKKTRAFFFDAADLTVRYNGSFSGEHGDGQSHGELLPLMFGDELVRGFNQFKSIWDPSWKMNPGKVVKPYRIDENLRLGTAYNPPPMQTHFQFPDDHGKLSEAILRCVGVGKCRRWDGGTMCPSFMVTHEEEHTTRGRARMIFEMLRGDLITGGWRDKHVKQSLDLCLACKGCKGDCPVMVDMATYKAEFLSHYYAGRLRPRSAYAFGLIFFWARLASRMPSLVNYLTQTPVLRSVAKAVVGMPQQRQIPAFASQTFKEWFRQRGPQNLDGPRVILWADTFTNHFHTAIAEAGVEVLEAAGYHVEVPQQPLCCGRPLYDYGMLDLAKKLLRQVLDTLGPQIAAGVPVVGLEPSCVAVFRDELPSLFPEDENARRLSAQSFLLSEFLEKRVENYQPPDLLRKAVVHGHCHHKALMKMWDEEAVLTKLGLDWNCLDSGCCGMAGSFGFEKDHYKVSIDAGERVLLPAVREAEKDTLIIADGFSCREQIAQTTDRQALHLAQVLQMALREGPAGPAGDYPETGYATRPARIQPSWLVPAALAGAGLLLAGGLLARRSNHGHGNGAGTRGRQHGT